MKAKLRIVSVVGARPNLMKLAPFAGQMAEYGEVIDHFVVHTGQHYDENMSKAFFAELDIPAPDVDLGVGSGSHAEQVGRTMIEFEKVLRQWKPDWVVVVGDVNAACACAITAKKERLRCAHIEAGLRSFDLDMPEEINRMVADRLSDVLFTPDELADANLRAEGAAPARIRRVGNIMIDTLDRESPRARALDPRRIAAAHLAGARAAASLPPLADDQFAALTLHRPSNVDDPATLRRLADLLVGEIARDLPLVWPLHPRTRKQLDAAGLTGRLQACANVVMTEPLGYSEMLRLNMGARVMLTDSGGLQEECCVLGTPCLTLRPNTERPATLIDHGGTCVLVGNDADRIRAAFAKARATPRSPHRPPLWDGHTAERITAFFSSIAAA